MQPTSKDRILAHPMLVIGLACLPIVFCGCAPIILTWMSWNQPPHGRQSPEYVSAHPVADRYVTVWAKSALTLEPAVSPARQFFSEDERAYTLNAVATILRGRFP